MRKLVRRFLKRFIEDGKPVLIEDDPISILLERKSNISAMNEEFLRDPEIAVSEQLFSDNGELQLCERGITDLPDDPLLALLEQDQETRRTPSGRTVPVIPESRPQMRNIKLSRVEQAADNPAIMDEITEDAEQEMSLEESQSHIPERTMDREFKPAEKEEQPRETGFQAMAEPSPIKTSMENPVNSKTPPEKKQDKTSKSGDTSDLKKIFQEENSKDDRGVISIELEDVDTGTLLQEAIKVKRMIQSRY